MRRHHPWRLFLIAQALAFLFAMTFAFSVLAPVVGLEGTLLPDPAVLMVVTIVAVPSGLATFPFLYFAMRDRHLGPGLTLLATGVVITILVATTVAPGMGFIGSYVAYALLLWPARAVSPLLVAEGHCRRCAYDLRGVPQAACCPECGVKVPSDHRGLADRPDP